MFAVKTSNQMSKNYCRPLSERNFTKQNAITRNENSRPEMRKWIYTLKSWMTGQQGRIIKEQWHVILARLNQKAELKHLEHYFLIEPDQYPVKPIHLLPLWLPCIFSETMLQNKQTLFIFTQTKQKTERKKKIL